MPIAGSIKIMLTMAPHEAYSGTANPQPRPWNSYGYFMSTTELVCGHNNLFDLRRDSYPIYIGWNFVDYRSVMIYNDETLGGGVAKVIIWFTEVLPGPGTIEMGLDPYEPQVRYQTSSGNSLVNRYQAPAGVVFSAPIDQATGLLVPLLRPGYTKALWFRRYVPPQEQPVEFDGASLAAYTSGVA